MENQQNGNLNDVFEITRGNLNFIINSLSEFPVKEMYGMINYLSNLKPVRVAEVAVPVPVAHVTPEETKTTEQ